MVIDSWKITRKDRQWSEELLEFSHTQEANSHGNGSQQPQTPSTSSLPENPTTNTVSFIANSSESEKNNASSKHLSLSKSHGKNHANDQGTMSENIALSYIKEETSKILNLNLELTIAMPLDPGK